MAIYGLNFNNTHIPEGYRRKFAVDTTIVRDNVPYKARLIGVTETKLEADGAMIVADNGHRKLQLQTRKVPGGVIYGIYELYRSTRS
jgi:hypothetical protein